MPVTNEILGKNAFSILIFIAFILDHSAAHHLICVLLDSLFTCSSLSLLKVLNWVVWGQMRVGAVMTWWASQKLFITASRSSLLCPRWENRCNQCVMLALRRWNLISLVHYTVFSTNIDYFSGLLSSCWTNLHGLLTVHEVRGVLSSVTFRWCSLNLTWWMSFVHVWKDRREQVAAGYGTSSFACLLILSPTAIEML